MQLYERQDYEAILSLPIPKFHSTTTWDCLIWPHSITGNYQVKKAYELLHQMHNLNNNSQLSVQNRTTQWKTLWRIKLPFKILTFTWKILHSSIPVRAELSKRGIHCDPLCGLCHCENETLTHLFIHCHFSRAVWLGIGINTSNLIEQEINVNHWITQMLQPQDASHNTNDTLIVILTTMWCIWFHRNQTIFEGKHLNPFDTILTSQSLINRYKHPSLDTITLIKDPNREPINYGHLHQDWQLLITTVGTYSKTRARQGIAFKGKNRTGQTIFVGSQSIKVRDNTSTKAMAVREASLVAYRMGFWNIIILTDSKYIEDIWRLHIKTTGI